jgi:branched-subunit amino acid transport protein
VSDLVFLFLALGAMTYLSRYLMFPLLSGRRLPQAVQDYLRLIPLAVLAGLAAANLAPAGKAVEPASLVGAAVAVATAWLSRNLLLTVLLGAAATALARLWGGGA